MRSYPRNSPQAAARIVALLLIADGHVSRSEMDALYGRDIERELGLPPGEFGQVLHTLCEDLLMGMRDRRLLTGHIDDATLAALLDEVTDAVLRQKSFVLCRCGRHRRPACGIGRGVGDGSSAEALAHGRSRSPGLRHRQLAYRGEPPPCAAATIWRTRGWCCPRRDQMACTSS